MNKLNPLGIGPKIGLVTLPCLALAIYFTLKFKTAFTFQDDGNPYLFYTGLALVIIGSIMYFMTAPALLIGIKNTVLVTKGTYYLCCNPLYASIILFIIPGISFMMNSWLILTVSMIGFLLYRIYIKSEYIEMEKFFGEEFRKYRTETPAFFPFPLKKWIKSF